MMKVFGWIGIILFALTLFLFAPLGWLMESLTLTNIGIITFFVAIANITIGIIINENQQR